VLAGEVAQAIATSNQGDEPRRVNIVGAPHLLFAQRLNPGSLFPAAFEVCVYPLADLVARQRQLRWQVIAAGGLLLLGGLVASNVMSRRLSAPVEQLAAESDEDRAQRMRAE